jgi:serine/threonine protein kinase/tetratricopeptide (TPR) repeat protein
VASDPTGDDATMLATGRSLSGGLRVGDRFAGRYNVTRELGRGAMGAVYAAHDEEVGEDVAIKVLTLPDEGALERFRREVRLARRVTHRNAARTYDLGEHSGIRYLTMELVAGDSLAERLHREPRMDPAEAAAIGVQICEGLQAVHEVGIVHRDLKPANVLLEATGRAVLTDFGVARALSGDAVMTVDRSALIGTPAYMAPEQVDGGEVDARTDLYALGAMLYEMLTGVRPFTGDTALAVAIARLQRDPADPRTHAELPEGLAAVVMRCLSRRADDRPATAGAVADALAQFAGSATARRTTLPGTATSAPLPATASGTGSVATRSLFASTSPGDRALAVLPFRFRGPAEDAYFAEVLTDELVDLLSMTRGLRVSGSGATAAYAEERDARKVGRELGVEAIVDGTVQRAGDRVRIAARLVTVNDGVQHWSERFEGKLEDVFDLQDRMAKRIAESLRVELITFAAKERAPAEVVEAYLRARSLAAQPDLTGASLEQAIDTYDACLQMYPTFPPALAGRAIACVQRWFLPSVVGTGGRDWAALAGEAVAAALQDAPHLAETHLAAARERVSRGDFITAAHHLHTALEIAPTFAGAHDYLGFLQCEAGRSEEGMRHILLARELDPTMSTNILSVLRALAMNGDDAGYERVLAEAKRDPKMPMFGVSFIEMRIAAWRGDLERVRATVPRLPASGENPAATLALLFRSTILGELTDDPTFSAFDEAMAKIASPRFRATTHQVAAEGFALLGRRDLALHHMREADADGVLVDADWFDRCPALESLRGEPEFIALRNTVRVRADAIWRSR